jgi:hypothetical protein
MTANLTYLLLQARSTFVNPTLLLKNTLEMLLGLLLRRRIPRMTSPVHLSHELWRLSSSECVPKLSCS